MSRPVLRFVASHSGPLVARGLARLGRSWRVETAGREHLDRARQGGRGVVYCFWHGRMLELALAHAGQGVGVLVSGHPDGIMAARIVAPLGYVPIRGSQRANAVAGFRGMVRYAQAGGDLAIAPDAHSAGNRALPGAVALARLTGHALVPVAAAADPCRRVESWDRFEIPWPGARVQIRYGAPVEVDRSADARTLKRATQALDRALRTLHERVEAELAVDWSPAPRRSRALSP